jgi:thiosulfate reductase cytochrome b subunit
MAQLSSKPDAIHKGWVRSMHWIVTVSFLVLAFSGFIILMAHPRLYWGDVGNDLTPALFELPISRNHKHGGWENNQPFFEGGSSKSASRTYETFNENGWGRSLHFLFAWFLVITGIAYLIAGVSSGHFRKHLWPGREFSFRDFVVDLKNHIRLRIPAATGGPQYGLLQRCSYMGVIFFGLPLAVVTGFAMSPAITSAYPFLSRMLGGVQSARTIHFFVSVALVLFLIVHILMLIMSGFGKQIRAMTIGKTYEEEKTKPDKA